MSTLKQLHDLNVLTFPCYADKTPAVRKGQDWRDVAQQDPDMLHWPSGVYGVALGMLIVILDLDTYKGITRAIANGVLKCDMPWDAALIQTTMRGGQHYAFRVPADWVVRQGSNLGAEGLDTRVGGLGFICSGDGYTWQNAGLFALVDPETLPVLPDACRGLLEHVEAAIPASTADHGDTDAQTLREALSHLTPDCGRTEWLRVGMALRHHFQDDEAEGFALFNDWSSGSLTGDAPHNYVAEHMEHQWGSLKPVRDGGATVTVGTLFYDAMQNGWVPPSTFDTAAAFGEGAAAADEFNYLVTRITESGSDLMQTLVIVEEIKTAGCNVLQRDLLTLALKAALKGAGVLDKTLSGRLDDMLRPDMPKLAKPSLAPANMPEVLEVTDILVNPLSQASAVHGVNALLMQTEVFADRAATRRGAMRWWSGREWATIPDEQMDRLTFLALMPDQSKAPNVSGTRAALRALSPQLQDCNYDNRIYFRGTVLDAGTGDEVPHSRANNNTGCLSVDYTPGGSCPEWHHFLGTIFGGTADGVGRVALLQEIIGWAILQGSLNVQKIVAFDGASRAGKGVILALIQDLLGEEKCAPVTFGDITDKKVQSSFRDSDVVIDMEAKAPARQEMKAAVSFMNKAISNEPVSVPLLYTQQPWKGRLNIKMIIGCNGIPTMVDDSGATTNRFAVLYFTRSFLGKEDKSLLGRLRGELPAIAAWAVEGAKRLIANQGEFTLPITSVEALNDLKGANQPMDAFINEYMEFGYANCCHSRDAWHAYRLYVIEANVKLPTERTFYKSLKQALLGRECQHKDSVRIKGETSTGYEGVAVIGYDTTSVTAAAFGSKA